MGSTNKTAHYELPQFVANDKPSWLGDVNQAMEAIDTGIYGAKSSADGAQTTANNAVAGVQTANTRMDGMQTQLDTVATQANQTATTVNQHTSSIATNSANINTLNSRMGSTDISDIGDGTVTGAIEAISGGGGGGASNVRWNATTDRFEVLKNGNWVQSIRAFVNSIAVWVAGQFGIGVDNGTHSYSTYVSSTAAFSVSDNNLVRDGNTVAVGTVATLVSTNLIDFTNYSTITVKNDKTADVTINVSGLTGNGYLAVYAFIRNNTNDVVVGVNVSTQKDNFGEYAIGSYKKEETASGTATTTIKISEITVE